MFFMTESAGTVLRRARTDARLSQTEVARRAGTVQSVVSAYESGQREPSLPMLRKLVAATGHELRLDLHATASDVGSMPNTRLGRLLRRRRKAVLDTATEFGASNVRVFGSVARGQDTARSDIDLLVDLNPGTGLVALNRLRRTLSDLLGVPVDVIPAVTLKPRIREEVLNKAIPL
jgi:predicted nucleotidyltransferase/DNA-binding XRE family transcriptional regulator